MIASSQTTTRRRRPAARCSAAAGSAGVFSEMSRLAGRPFVRAAAKLMAVAMVVESYGTARAVIAPVGNDLTLNLAAGAQFVSNVAAIAGHDNYGDVYNGLAATRLPLQWTDPLTSLIWQLKTEVFVMGAHSFVLSNGEVDTLTGISFGQDPAHPLASGAVQAVIRVDPSNPSQNFLGDDAAFVVAAPGSWVNGSGLSILDSQLPLNDGLWASASPALRSELFMAGRGGRLHLGDPYPSELAFYDFKLSAFTGSSDHNFTGDVSSALYGSIDTRLAGSGANQFPLWGGGFSLDSNGAVLSMGPNGEKLIYGDMTATSPGPQNTTDPLRALYYRNFVQSGADGAGVLRTIYENPSYGAVVTPEPGTLILQGLALPLLLGLSRFRHPRGQAPLRATHPL